MLRLLGELHFHQHLPNRHVQGITKETESAHVTPQDILGEIIIRGGQDGGDDAPADRFFETGEVFGRGISFLTLRHDHRGLAGEVEGLRLRPGRTGGPGRRCMTTRGVTRIEWLGIVSQPRETQQTTQTRPTGGRDGGSARLRQGWRGQGFIIRGVAERTFGRGSSAGSEASGKIRHGRRSARLCGRGRIPSGRGQTGGRKHDGRGVERRLRRIRWQLWSMIAVLGGVRAMERGDRGRSGWGLTAGAFGPTAVSRARRQRGGLDRWIQGWDLHRQRK